MARWWLSGKQSVALARAARSGRLGETDQCSDVASRFVSLFVCSTCIEPCFGASGSNLERALICRVQTSHWLLSIARNILLGREAIIEIVLLFQAKHSPIALKVYHRVPSIDIPPLSPECHLGRVGQPLREKDALRPIFGLAASVDSTTPSSR